MFDIATFFNNQLNQEGYSIQTRGLLDAFLDGYQSIRPLSATEMAVLPAFVALRQIWLWGISMTNRPMAGFGLFEQWMREISLPTLRDWVNIVGLRRPGRDNTTPGKHVMREHDGRWETKDQRRLPSSAPRRDAALET